MITFVVVYGGFVDEAGKLNKDAAGRCDKAIAIAKKYLGSNIVYGGGPFIPRMPELAERTVKYLLDRGWSPTRIIWSPKGTDTVDETTADLEVVAEPASQWIERIFVVTSWYHLPRVWLIWKILGGGKASFRPAWPTAHCVRSLIWECGGYAVLLKRLIREITNRRVATS